MTVGVMVTRLEAELVKKLWPKPSKGEPTVRDNLVEFSCAYGRRILRRLLERGDDDVDTDAACLFLDRVIDLCGPALLNPETKPLDGQQDLFHRGCSTEEHF